MSPLTITLFIVLGVTFVGATIAFVRDRRRYAGYADIMRDAMALSRSIGGDIFRDGGDLVVSATYSGAPLVVRFSHAETTPGLMIHLGAPATFSLAIFPRAERAYENRALVRTTDEIFNTRFEARTDQPTTAKVFLSSRKVMDAVRALCRSGNDFLHLGDAAVELRMMGAPTPEMVQAVAGQLEHVGTIATALTRLPGSENVKILPVPRQRRIALRVAIVAGVIATAMAIYIAAKPSQETRVASEEDAIPAGLSAAEAEQIGDLKGWRVGKASDGDATTAEWLRGAIGSADGRVEFDAYSSGSPEDRAYFLVGNAGEKRVVMIVGGQKVFDQQFAMLGGIGRVAKKDLKSIEWFGRKPSDIAGDAVLVVREGSNQRSGIVFYLNKKELSSASPMNYQYVAVSR